MAHCKLEIDIWAHGHGYKDPTSVGEPLESECLSLWRGGRYAGRMNWLTAQLAQLHYFGDLAQGGLDAPEPGLRILPYVGVYEALRGIDVSIDADSSLDPYFLLAEDVEFASARAGRAVAVSAQMPLPPTFTLALDDGKGTVLYLPEDQLPTEDLQLFVFVDQRISRVRSGGEFGESYARPFITNIQPLLFCSDGPCQVWGQACGEGCECRKREVTDAVYSRLPEHFISGPGHTYTLVCE